MEPESSPCSLCGQAPGEGTGPYKVLELKASGATAAVCPSCYAAIGDGGDDEFLEFLLSA